MTRESVVRRLAAILAADVVGFSRLCRLDEAGTLARLRQLRIELIEPKFSEHGGRLFKTMGDGLLAEFPSVVSAVSCAAEIQTVLAERNSRLEVDQAICLRIGVNLGDVIVEGDDVLGDGVNVAVRLESIAPPGGIVVSRTVRENTGNRLDLDFVITERTCSRTLRPRSRSSVLPCRAKQEE